MILKSQQRNFIYAFLLFVSTYLVLFYCYTNETYTNSSYPSIFCIILTHRQNFKTQTAAVHKTWAPYCNKYFFIANRNGSNKFPILEPSNLKQDQYNKLTDKVFGAIKDVYQKYPNYDWYLKVDDDTYVFMEHLKEFLETKDPKRPITFGYDIKYYVKDGYHAGGPGYVMSNEAFKRLGSALSSNYSLCPNSGIEDVDVGKCLRALNVTPESSLDENGRERFHICNISTVIKNKLPEAVYKFSKNTVKAGIECCSEKSISFHYMSHEAIEKLHKLWQKFKIEKRRNTPGLNFTLLLLKMVDE